jgi:hypothetical protein
MFSKIARMVLLAALSATPMIAVGCSTEVDLDSEEDDVVAGIAFTELDLHASVPKAGVTLITNTADFKKFFHVDPPAELSFNKKWVLHVSGGMAQSGGFSVDVEKISKSKKTLTVRAVKNAPGQGCKVTKNITNPQITVMINKQSSSLTAKLDLRTETYDCTPSSTCGSLQGVCMSSPFDVTFGADCEGELGMKTAQNGTCPAFNQSCCVPKTCGGIANLKCASGTICIDNPNDSCDPKNGGADCGGICVKDKTCGGIANLKCPKGLTCVDRPDSCDPNNGGADCSGVCAPVVKSDRETVSGFCVKSRNDSCTSDAECSTGGCGGELCYNPKNGSGISTCECTAPSYSCGCVNGKCAWYQ